MKSEIEKLESVHPDLITTFLTTGEGKGIPEDVQIFLKQLQWAAEIYEYERRTAEDLPRCAYLHDPHQPGDILLQC